MSSSKVLLLPGWQNSGPRHWQSLWEREHGYTRVEQSDWMRPRRGDWIARLEEVLLEQPEPVTLVAHSLGCHLVAAWAAHTKQVGRVKCALLVTPADVERDDMRSVLPSWSPIVMQALPFKTQFLASQTDPFCTMARSREMATAWGSTFLDYGKTGHINADTGLDTWPHGHLLLQELQQASE